MTVHRFTVEIATADPDTAREELERAVSVWFHQPAKARRLYGSKSEGK